MTTVAAVLALTSPASSHLLTCSYRDDRGGSFDVSTAIEVGPDHSLDVELVHVAHLIDDVVAAGWRASLLLRTFDLGSVAFHAPNGCPIPFKTVRGWLLDDRRAYPLTEASMFNAFCTDNATGEPIPPERGVLFADAWEVAL